MKKLFILFLLNLLFTNKSFALIEIDITRGNLDPLPIAVSLYMLILSQKMLKELRSKSLVKIYQKL